jgi:hypothetical protein
MDKVSLKKTMAMTAWMNGTSEKTRWMHNPVVDVCQPGNGTRYELLYGNVKCTMDFMGDEQSLHWFFLTWLKFEESSGVTIKVRANSHTKWGYVKQKMGHSCLDDDAKFIAHFINVHNCPGYHHMGSEVNADDIPRFCWGDGVFNSEPSLDDDRGSIDT